MAPGLPRAALAVGLLALLLPGTRGDCGPLPGLRTAAPPGLNRTEGFPAGTRVTYRCLAGFVKIPGKSDTVVCLGNAHWSNLEEFCGRSCDAPKRLTFAALNAEDEMKSFYPAGISVRYTCRPGYEPNTEMNRVSTCLDNFTWSEVSQFCRKKSCGHPGEILHGKAVDVRGLQFGESVTFLCEEGYRLIGKPFIQCLLDETDVKWSKGPTCQVITCPPPPSIANGTANDRGVSNFAYNSTVNYRCDRGFQLIGAASIRCTTKDKMNGIWSELPKCQEEASAHGVQLKGNERSGASSGSFNLASNLVLEQHPKNKAKGKYTTSSFQNTWFISSSHSSSFRTCGWRRVGSKVALPLFRFATPAYIKSTYCSVRTKRRCVCHQSYMGISGALPSRTCFKYLKWQEVPGFCGNRSWLSKRTRAWQSCCYNRFPIRCKSIFRP